MLNPYYYFNLKYCALCFEPLEEGFSGTCPVCGQKTTAINFSERLKKDGTISKKDKNAPKIAAVLLMIACVLEIVYCIVAMGFTSGTLKLDDPAKKMTLEEYAAQYQPAEQKQNISREYEEALKYDNIHDYISSKSPHSQEEIQHYFDIYKRAWFDFGLSQPSGQQTVLQDPQPKNDKNSSNWIIAFGVLGSRSEVGMIVTATYIILSLYGIAVCVVSLRGTDKSIMYLTDLAINYTCLVGMTCNSLSVVLMIIALCKLIKLHTRISGGKLRLFRAQKIHKAKNPLGDTDEWCCEYCGYINNKRDLECKSCGKYRY